MKAIVKREKGPGLWLEDRPVPEVKERSVLIKVEKASICGTDLHIYRWDEWAKRHIAVPITIGHEFVGRVEKVGSGVTTVKEGDRVSAEGHLTCGSCINCLRGKKHLCINTRGVGIHTDGCFAEFLLLPEDNVFKIPEKIEDRVAAIFDPFGNAVHTALSFPLAAEDVLITGAGPIGVMAAAICRHCGARSVVVTDINDYRLSLAKTMGATEVINVKTKTLNQIFPTLGIEEGFSLGFEMSGNAEAFSSMLQAMRHGGKAALLGLLPKGAGIDWDQVIFKMLHIKGIYGREIFGTWQQMTALIDSGLSLKPVITHEFPFDEFEKGFDTMFSGQCGKVILNLT